jgi:guanylate kinase
MSHGLILYGPPASGKDTVSAALTATDHRFQLYYRLKAGPGRTSGYRMTTTQAMDELEQKGQIVWQNQRYDSRYVIERESLLGMLHRDEIPVIHAGQPEVITAVRSATPNATWTVAQLWCPRDIARARIIERGTGDIEARLAAWEATPHLNDADLNIDTSLCTPADSAEAIRHTVETAWQSST